MTDFSGLLRPPPLRPGDTIGVAAPAGPFDPERFDFGRARLEAMGFPTVCPDQIYERDGFLAGRDEDRARTWNDLWSDPRIKAIFCARGGYGSMRILDLVDYERVRADPKIVVGFSDLTALLLALHQTTGLVCFHGPVVTSLADEEEDGLDHLTRLLTGLPVFPLEIDPDRVLMPGRTEGPLLGGNLTMLVHLMATPWLPDLSGAILFIEETGEAPYRVDRMLTTLRLAGLLERCAGIVLGHFENCGDAEALEGVLRGNLAGFHGPVAAGLPAGHGRPNLALPLGPRAVLDTELGLFGMVENYLDSSPTQVGPAF
ncbi:MAG: LD-carboxypeptidase [Proteobacteria bacterium]|nr:LD-carboxypeptidase [Pseudomonadota bacterium]